MWIVIKPISMLSVTWLFYKIAKVAWKRITCRHYPRPFLRYWDTLLNGNWVVSFSANWLVLKAYSVCTRICFAVHRSLEISGKMATFAPLVRRERESTRRLCFVFQQTISQNKARSASKLAKACQNLHLKTGSVFSHAILNDLTHNCNVIRISENVAADVDRKFYVATVETFQPPEIVKDA